MSRTSMPSWISNTNWILDPWRPCLKMGPENMIFVVQGSFTSMGKKCNFDNNFECRRFYSFLAWEINLRKRLIVIHIVPHTIKNLCAQYSYVKKTLMQNKMLHYWDCKSCLLGCSCHMHRNACLCSVHRAW